MVSTSLDLNITTLEDYTIEMMEKCELILLDAFECMINKDLAMLSLFVINIA